MKQFLPSRHGFHFENDFTEAPVIKIPLVFGQHIDIGNASGGLCGGMVFAALDFYIAGQPVPTDTTAPVPDSKLFKFLCQRLVNSFDIPFGVMQFYTWMSHSGSLIGRTATFELPAICSHMETLACPVPLGLILVESKNPAKLGDNHQVLAYDASVSADGAALRIYDPNYPDRDDVFLAITPTSCKHSITGNIRGFFRTHYQV